MIVLSHLVAYGGLVGLVAILFWAVGREGSKVVALVERVARQRGWEVDPPEAEEAPFELRCGRVTVTVQLGGVGRTTKAWAPPVRDADYRRGQADEGALDQRELGEGMYLSEEDGVFLVEDVRPGVSAERLLFMVDHLLERCDPSYRLPDEPAQPASRTPEQRFTRSVLAILCASFVLGILLTLAGGPVRALQSRVLCDAGEELVWVKREHGSERSFSLACGDDGETIACLSAGLLATHVFAFPLLGVALFVTRRR